MNTTENNTSNDDKFPPLGGGLAADKSLLTNPSIANKFYSCKLTNSKPRIYSTSRSATVTNRKVYTSTLCVDAAKKSKRPKFPFPRRKFTMAVKKEGMSVMIKQELIEDKDLIPAFAPVFQMKKEPVKHDTEHHNGNITYPITAKKSARQSHHVGLEHVQSGNKFLPYDHLSVISVIVWLMNVMHNEKKWPREEESD